GRTARTSSGAPSAPTATSGQPPTASSGHGDAGSRCSSATAIPSHAAAVAHSTASSAATAGGLEKCESAYALTIRNSTKHATAMPAATPTRPPDEPTYAAADPNAV